MINIWTICYGSVHVYAGYRRCLKYSGLTVVTSNVNFLLT